MAFSRSSTAGSRSGNGPRYDGTPLPRRAGNFVGYSRTGADFPFAGSRDTPLSAIEAAGIYRFSTGETDAQRFRMYRWPYGVCNPYENFQLLPPGPRSPESFTESVGLGSSSSFISSIHEVEAAELSISSVL